MTNAYEERERYRKERELVIEQYDVRYWLVTKNLAQARLIRDECKNNGTLEKIESRRYNIDRYFGERGIKAGVVLYSGIRDNGVKVFILSARTGLGGQVMRV